MVPSLHTKSSNRQIGFEEERNDQRLREYLNFVDELREEAFYKTLKYKQLMPQSYNRRVKNRQFHSGDLVLRLLSELAKRTEQVESQMGGVVSGEKYVGPTTYELED
ncbi:hypothetical protein LIER_08685 [Lithospermum erythrorhizon]|uniref:Uncharacterized protein n=1 Tax=Lithospermum erythrorhizon TaxID=34254 RepID=A0AAV3PDS7_LITER